MRNGTMNKLERTIDHFILKQTKAFTLQSVIEAVTTKLNKKLDMSIEELEDLILSHPDVFLNDNNNLINRYTLFQDVCFRIKLTEAEYERQVLFTGHRFSPFANFNTSYEDEIRLVDKNKKPLKTKKIQIPIEETLRYYTLIGINEIPDVEVIDHKIGVFSVWDLSELLANNDFHSNDTIIAHCLDHKKNLYELIIETSEQMQKTFTNIRKSDRMLEEALLQVFETHPPFLPADSQLFFAYGLCDPWILKNPGQHFGGLLNKSNSIELNPIDRIPILSKKGENVLQKGLQDAKDYTQTGKSSSLEEILRDIGSSFNRITILAMMKQHIHMKVKKADAFAEIAHWLLPYGNAMFVSEQQQNAFWQYIEKLWTKARNEERKSPTPKKLIALRQQALKLRFQIINILREIDSIENLQPEELPEEPMMKLMEVDAFLETAFELSNRVDSGQHEQSLNEILSNLDFITDLIKELESEIMDALFEDE